MNYKIYTASMIIGFTCSTLAIFFGVLSLNLDAWEASAPVAPITCNCN